MESDSITPSSAISQGSSTKYGRHKGYVISEDVINQEAARLSSLALEAAFDQILQEKNRSPINTGTQITILTLSSGSEESLAEGKRLSNFETGQVVEGPMDIEEYLKLEAENLYYSELCSLDPDPQSLSPKRVTSAAERESGSGEGLKPPDLSLSAVMARRAVPEVVSGNSEEIKNNPISADWAKAKEFTPRAALSVPPPKSIKPAGQPDAENSTPSSEKDSKCYYNNNNCHDRLIQNISVKLATEERHVSRGAHQRMNTGDGLDMSGEDNSQSDVLDIIVLPDSTNPERVPDRAGIAPYSAPAVITPNYNTKPSMCPPPYSRLPRASFRPPSASRVPISMILPARPPCRPPFMLPPPSLHPVRQPAFFMPHPPLMPRFACPPPGIPPRFAGADARPYYPPPIPCFYPPDSPPPGVQYGYPQRGKRRKAQRLSSRFPTQAGKFHHHANFYVKSCAESVVANRGGCLHDNSYPSPPNHNFWH